MIVATVILLTLNLASAQIISNPDSSCDYNYQMTAGQSIAIDNPGWPAVYPQGLVCRWIVDCPAGSICRLKCLDVGLPQSNECSSDKLLVSAMGNVQLHKARVFCGRSIIDVKCLSNRLTMGLIATSKSPGGRFRCDVTSEMAM